MQAVVIEGFGGVEQFKNKELPIPEVKENYVRIKLKAASFNPVDYKIRKGLFGGEFPMALGQDGSGIIDEVGPGVTNFKKGDEVYAFIFGLSKSNGANAEYASLPQQYVAHKPKSLSFDEAAGVPLVGLTAFGIIDKAKPVKGQPVFVTGASGGVGSLVIYLLRDIGAYPIITTAGSDTSAEYITSHLGIPKEHIVRYDKVDKSKLAAEVKKIVPDGVPIAIDLWGGDMKHLSFNVIAIDGHVLTIVEEPAAFATPLYPSVSPQNSLFSNNGTFTMVFIGARAFSPAIKDPSGWAVYQEDLTKLAKLIDEGRVKVPQVTNVGKLTAKDVAKAHELLEDGHTKGKLVISIP